MKTSRTMAALAAALLLGTAWPGSVSAQPDAGKAPAAADAGAAASDAGAPAPKEASPLPPGHPQVEDEDEAPGGAQGNQQMFNPPPDVAQDDASLPRGAIVVTIKDAKNQPISRAPVVLGILHNTVAKGESRERQERVADDTGSVRFDNLPVGSGVTYRVSTSRGSASYQLAPFALSDKAGKRVSLHSYEVSGKLDDLPVALQGMVYVSLREDSIQVEQLLNVYNLGPVSWIANQPMPLPADYKAFNKQEAMGDARVEEDKGANAAVLRGTFPPGRAELDFRYQIPLSGEARQTIRIQLPPRVAQGRIIAESSKTMGLEVAGFPAAQRSMGRDGKRLLITENQGSRAAGGLGTFEITLTGLPTRGPGRWYAAGLAAIALVAGISYLISQRKNEGLDADARADLREAREALLGEIVALERAFRNQEVGPKTYERVRASLLDALARIVTMLNDAKPAETRKGRRRAEAT